MTGAEFENFIMGSALPTLQGQLPFCHTSCVKTLSRRVGRKETSLFDGSVMETRQTFPKDPNSGALTPTFQGRLWHEDRHDDRNQTLGLCARMPVGALREGPARHSAPHDGALNVTTPAEAVLPLCRIFCLNATKDRGRSLMRTALQTEFDQMRGAYQDQPHVSYDLRWDRLDRLEKALLAAENELIAAFDSSLAIR